MTSRVGRWAPLLAGIVLVGTLPLAARTTFNPVISLDYLYVDNVQYVGEEGTADSGFRLRLKLPVVRELRKGSLSFTYSPQIERYKDFRELDNTGHRVDLNLRVTPTQVSAVSVSTSYLKTQDQSDPTDPGNEIFLGRRTERETGTFDLSYRNRLAGRFLWGFNSRFEDSTFKNIEGFDPGDAPPIEDRQTMRTSVDLLRSLSRTSRVGIRVGYSRFELELGLEGESRELSLLLERALGERTDFTMSLGAFESEDTTPAEAGIAPEVSRTGIQGFVALSRQLRKASLSLDARRSATAGGILPGTSTDSSLAFYVSNDAGRRWTWSTHTRYVRREPNIAELDTIDTVALGFSVGFRIVRRLQLHLSPVYTRQVGNDPGVDSLVLRGGFGFSWAPLERTRLGGAGS